MPGMAHNPQEYFMACRNSFGVAWESAKTFVAGRLGSHGSCFSNQFKKCQTLHAICKWAEHQAAAPPIPDFALPVFFCWEALGIKQMHLLSSFGHWVGVTGRVVIRGIGRARLMANCHETWNFYLQMGVYYHVTSHSNDIQQIIAVYMQISICPSPINMLT